MLLDVKLLQVHALNTHTQRKAANEQALAQFGDTCLKFIMSSQGRGRGTRTQRPTATQTHIHMVVMLCRVAGQRGAKNKLALLGFCLFNGHTHTHKNAQTALFAFDFSACLTSD